LIYSYDYFDNISSINEGTIPLVSYLNDGSGNPMQTIYNQPDISLTYFNGGMDRYAQIINHSWVKNTNPLVHIIHSYDYSGNRIKRYDPVHAANSELYTYDNLGQIKTLNRGVLNSDHTSVTTINHSESWNFDKTGNWAQYTKNGNTENRTHNAANELQGIATHDANGNMVLISGLKGKYDAWNRLVEVRDSNDNLIAQYEYNGLNQRIKKTVGTAVTKSFFNEKWQEIESQTGSEITSYVWGIQYIDDLIVRVRDEEYLYSLVDTNWNIVALCDNNGIIQERYKYDAFGKIKILNNNFVEKAFSNFDWNRTFTSQVFDIESGLLLFKNRYYCPNMGRFINRDPIGFKSNEINFYRYVGNCSITFVDPYGEKYSSGSTYEVGASYYAIFGGGLEIGNTIDYAPCCKDGELNPNGIKREHFKVYLKGGIGIGLNIKLFRWKFQVQLTGPQLYIQFIDDVFITNDCEGTYCYRPCLTFGLEFGGGFNVGVFIAGVSGTFSVTFEFRYCLSAGSACAPSLKDGLSFCLNPHIEGRWWIPGREGKLDFVDNSSPTEVLPEGVCQKLW
jgi:RHS repeat-associated protein